MRGTEDGPSDLRASGLVKKLRERGLSASWPHMLYPDFASRDIDLPTGQPSFFLNHQICLRLARTVSETLADGQFPVVIGGDHVIAAGTWSGAAHYLRTQNKDARLGLLWVDAHMDAHTPETSPSDAYHGMPVASLLGHGGHALTRLLNERPKLDPRGIVMIGPRSFEDGEEALLKRLGVTVFYDADVREKGFGACFQMALKQVKQHSDAFGMTIDLDVFDPNAAPGVGTPEENGLQPSDVLPALMPAAADPNFLALEVVELNPHRDVDQKTQKLATDLLGQLLCAHATRKKLSEAA